MFKRNDPIEEFQDRTIETPIAFVGNPGSGGQGLTLNASKVAVFFSNDFSNDYRPQAESRISGIGCRGRDIIDIMCLGSDYYVREALFQKEEVSSLTLEELKRWVRK